MYNIFRKTIMRDMLMNMYNMLPLCTILKNHNSTIKHKFGETFALVYTSSKNEEGMST